MNDPSKSVVFDRVQIQKTVERLAGEVTLWLEGTDAKGLNLVSILEGARPFTRDLSALLKKRRPDLRIQVHEVRVKGTDGTTLLKDRQLQSPFPTAENLRPYPLLIVDDLVDSGLTLKLLKQEMENLKGGPVKTVVLIRKFGERSASGLRLQAETHGLGVPVPDGNRFNVDFCGFELDLDLKELAAKGLKDYWLYGYGMDLDGRQRDLDHIGWVAISATGT
jgi:hypoxanthine-guanine phosphoribosyltransferase